jgi:niacin transporter
VKNNHILKITISGLLIAIGFIIPMFSPLKIVIEPASYTLASHVPIFIAMFISPYVAIAVCIGTTLGFFFSGIFPIIVTLRAASHIVFVIVGSLFLHELSKGRLTEKKLWIFSGCIGLIHGAIEVAVVSAFYISLTVGEVYYERGWLVSVLLLVGFGTVIHSMIDFKLAHIIIMPLKKVKGIGGLFGKV